MKLEWKRKEKQLIQLLMYLTARYGILLQYIYIYYVLFCSAVDNVWRRVN